MRASLLLLLILPILTHAQPPPGYYDATYGLSGASLRQALYQIISGHTVIPNGQLWDVFAITDRKPDDTVWDMYSDIPSGTPPYVYEFVVDQCGTYNSEGDCFNREHTFPQSWFNDQAPMTTDVFHIYPADAWVNQQRGNLPFGNVGAANWTSQNGGKRGVCDWPGFNGTVFEPIDAYKGDLARSYFYMLTRYLPQLAAWNTPMMEAGDLTGWASSLLIAWHELDPVSQKEIDRNNAVFGLQGNRNPFIDQPHWVHYIWGPTASVAEDTAPELSLWHSNATLYVRSDRPDATATLNIFDATGRSIQHEILNSTTLDLPLDLPTGIYIATYKTTEAIKVIRFVH